MLTFAVGDVHGCYRKLAQLLAQCRTYAASRTHRFVFLGDYIDRGSDSRAVMELLIELETAANPPPIFLRGNHEQMLLDGLRDSTAELHWILNSGGDTTLASYGVLSAAELPPAHLSFLERTRLSFDDGLRFFVHAGINPDRPLFDQDPHDLLWVREPFLSSENNFGRIVVHGHSPTRNGKPDIQPNRINIDTGAVFGHPLTAAIFMVVGKPPPIAITQSAIALYEEEMSAIRLAETIDRPSKTAKADT